MKAIYKKPESLVIAFNDQFYLMAESIQTTETVREDTGDPTQSGLPTSIGTTEENEDPYGEHGVDGNSTRAKGGMIWDEW